MENLEEYKEKELRIIIEQLEEDKQSLSTENNLLFDYVDGKMVEGCEEATRLIDNILQQNYE